MLFFVLNSNFELELSTAATRTEHRGSQQSIIGSCLSASSFSMLVCRFFLLASSGAGQRELAYQRLL
jgi:hypothetical protein